MKYYVIISVTLIAAFAAAIVSAEVIQFENPSAEFGFRLLDQSPSSVRLSFGLPSIDIEEMVIDGESVQAVTMPGAMLPNNPGKPNLPGNGRMIAIPQGAAAEFRIISSTTEILEDIDLAPAPPIPLETDDSPLEYRRDPGIYNRDAYYPENPVMISEPSKIRGVDYVMLGITPFQYNPMTRRLIVYTGIDVEITFDGGNGQFGENRLRSRYWEPILRQNLINYESLPKIDFSFKPGPSDEEGFEYLIIIPDDPDFEAWGDTLKDWRNKQGILTGMVSLSEIGGNNASAIEAYINDAYENWDIPPAAFLLLSDYQNTGDTYGITSPIWNNYCVSDNIYADIDDNNLPDIAHARICARDSSHLRRMITKMLDYERDPPTEPSVYANPVIAGGWQTERWFILCTEICLGYMETRLGKSPTREYAIYQGTPGTIWSTAPNTSALVNYFGPNGLGYIPETPEHLTDCGGNATRINNDINDGTFILLHRDHGSVNGWGEPSYGTGNLSGLHNDVFPFVLSINCLTGMYNSGSQCFTEAFHRMDQEGALGLTAASEVSYSFVNDTYIFGMMDLFWPDFDPGYGTSGPVNPMPAFANVSGKIYLQSSGWPYNSGNKVHTYHLFHHHGDAFISMYTEVPQDMTVNHADIQIAGLDSFTVTADEGALIALSVDGEILGTAIGTGGPINIEIEPQTPGTHMLVTVTKPNYFRYERDVEVVPDQGYGIIRGRATDLVTGDGLPAFVQTTNREPLIAANCDEDGYYYMYVPADTVWDFTATYTEDYLDAFGSASVPEGDTSVLNFSLEPKTEVILTASFGNPGDIDYRTFYVRGSWDDGGFHDTTWSCSFTPIRDDGVFPDEIADDGVFTGQIKVASDQHNSYRWAVYSEDYNNHESRLQYGADFNIPTPGNSPSVPTLSVNPSGNQHNWILSIYDPANGLFVDLNPNHGGTPHKWSGTASVQTGNIYEFRIYPMHSDVASYGIEGVGGMSFYLPVHYTEDLTFIFDDMEDTLFIESDHPQPTDLTATEDMDRMVELNWVSPATAPSSYNVYRAGSMSGPFTFIGAMTHPTTVYIDSTISNYIDYYYHVTAVYAGGIESIPSNTAHGYAITGARMAVNPDQINVNVNRGDTAVTELYISNSGDLDLEYLIRNAEDGSGGPDAFGYSWIDSDEPAGPQFNWIDISGVGTVIEFSDPDNANSGPLPLGFTFNYYGQEYGSINVCTNGWASFTDSTSTNYGTRPIPDPAPPNNLLALFVDRLTFEYGGRAYFYTNNTDTAIVTWEDASDVRQTGIFTFQVILIAPTKIVYQYDNVGPGRLDQCSVGIENGTGTIGLEVVYAEQYLHDNLAIGFFMDWIGVDPDSGIVEPGMTDTVTVVLNARSLQEGDYTGTIDVYGSDRYHQEDPVSIPVALHVDPQVDVPEEGQSANLPSSFALHQNYPNPFNPTTTIHYDLPRACEVKLEIYNILGQRVETLIDGHRAAGYRSVVWNSRHFASGIYFYKLTAGDQALARRMTLLK